MEEEKIVQEDDFNPSIEPVVESEEKEEQEDIEELKGKLLKAEEVAKNQKIRAEKAEKENKNLKTSGSKTFEPSASDIFAIVSAKVSEEDFPEVLKFAQFQGVSVSEALKDPIVKTLLQAKEENRRTTEATNVSSNRRSVTKVTDETLVQASINGELPESEADIARLALARRRMR